MQQKIALAQPKIGKLARRYVAECFKENRLTSGRFNAEFETRFAAFLGVPHAAATPSGTMALVLALKAAGVGPGDEVIMPTFTFCATAEAVLMVSATPVFVDSEEGSWNIDPRAVEQAITKKTKAIIVVHLYGVMADMAPLKQIARRRKCVLIEDAAEALGATYRGKQAGSIGDMGCFSFYGNKVITTGEGGMVTTASGALAKSLLLYRNHGMGTKRYWHEVPGINGKLTNLQAAIGVSQMEDLPKFLIARHRIFTEYARLLKDVEGIGFAKVPEDSTVSPWFVTVRVAGKKKEMVVEALGRVGIESRPGFYPCHLMPAYKPYAKKNQRFQVAEKISKEIVNLPTHPALTVKEVKAVCAALCAIVR